MFDPSQDCFEYSNNAEVCEPQNEERHRTVNHNDEVDIAEEISAANNYSASEKVKNIIEENCFIGSMVQQCVTQLDRHNAELRMQLETKNRDLKAKKDIFAANSKRLLELQIRAENNGTVYESKLKSRATLLSKLETGHAIATTLISYNEELNNVMNQCCNDTEVLAKEMNELVNEMQTFAEEISRERCLKTEECERRIQQVMKAKEAYKTERMKKRQDINSLKMQLGNLVEERANLQANVSKTASQRARNEAYLNDLKTQAELNKKEIAKCHYEQNVMLDKCHRELQEQNIIHAEIKHKLSLVETNYDDNVRLLQHLKVEETDLTEKKALLIEQYNRKREELNSLNMKLQQTEEKLGEGKKKCSELQFLIKEFDGVEAENIALNTINQEVKESNKSLTNLIQSEKEIINELNIKHQNAQSELQQLKEDAHKLTEESLHVANNVDDLKAQLNQLTTERDSIVQSSSEHTNIIKSQIEESQIQVKQLSELNAKLKSDLQSSSTNSLDLAASIQLSKEQLTDVQTVIAVETESLEKERQNNKIKEELKANEIAKLEKQIEEINTSAHAVVSVELEREDLKRSLKSQEEKHSKRKEDILREFNEKIQAVQLQEKSYKERGDIMLKEEEEKYEVLKKKYEEIGNNNTNVIEEIKIHESELQTVNERVNSYRKLIAEIEYKLNLIQKAAHMSTDNIKDVINSKNEPDSETEQKQRKKMKLDSSP